MNRSIRLVVSILLLTTAQAAEPWADPKLPVRDGLELWLDAARASGDKILSGEATLAEWRDASGKGRHLRQDALGKQPSRFPAGGHAVFRFDGNSQYLRAVK